MVALEATLCSNQLLIKSEERLIDFKHVVVPLLDEVFYYYIGLVGMR